MWFMSISIKCIFDYDYPTEIYTFSPSSIEFINLNFYVNEGNRHISWYNPNEWIVMNGFHVEAHSGSAMSPKNEWIISQNTATLTVQPVFLWLHLSEKSHIVQVSITLSCFLFQRFFFLKYVSISINIIEKKKLHCWIKIIIIIVEGRKKKRYKTWQGVAGSGPFCKMANLD